MEKSCVEVISFLSDQEAQGKSANTVNTYKRILDAFCDWLNKNGGEITDLTRFDVQAYIKALENEEKSPATVDKVFACLSVYARFIERPDIVSNIKRIMPEKKANKAPKSIEQLEIKRIKREVEKSGNQRNIAIVYTLIETGVRVSELCALNREDIEVNERSGKLFVREGKGSKFRTVPLSREVRYHINKYLAERSDNDPALFLSNYKSRISVRAVQHMLKEYGTHPHELRHTFVRTLVKAGNDISTVAELAGHDDINVTRRYSKPSERELVEAIEKAFS